MELRMTVHVPRRRPHPVDVVVRARGTHRAAELRAALARHLGEPVPGLTVRGRPVPDETRVGSPPLLDGTSVVVTAATGGAPAVDPSAEGALELVAVSGPDAGRSHPLRAPGMDIGRSPEGGFRLADPALSRVHARVTVGAEGVRVHDLGSTNGILVDGHPARGPTRLDTSSVLDLGGTTLRLRRGPGAGLPVRHPGDGTVRVPETTPRRDPVLGVRVSAPPEPVAAHRARIPWLAALLPVPVALALAWVLGPQLLAFAVLGPVMVLGSALGDRWSGRRRDRAAGVAHASAEAAARARLAEAVAEECRRRHLTHPDPHTVLTTAERALPGLWGAERLQVRLGIGDVEARTCWVVGTEERHERAAGVPVVVDLAEVGQLGVVGGCASTRRVLDWITGQLCVRHAPGELGLARPRAPDDAHWNWLPHARDGAGPDAVGVLVLDDAAVGGAVEQARQARAAGWAVVVAARRAEDLPPGCGAVLSPGPPGRQQLALAAGGSLPLVADGVGSWWTERLVRALAPLRAGDGAAPSGAPASLTLEDVLSRDELSVDAILRRWVRGAGTGPVAVVGAGGSGPHRIDLVRDGPHLLVGGTTGSGKSEFLRTLVTGLALDSPPDALALLLVDFKGGAAFGACEALPHVVGVVTDLDDHLVGRVLSSLRAELRRREELLARAGVSDLADLAGTVAPSDPADPADPTDPAGPADRAARPGDPHDRRASGVTPRPPRLVVVVDELRALVEELPEFVSGLVRIAAQGRSLGIHLVLATQRPSGTISAEIRANVDLRIAFRVRDRADSLDVVDDPGAADLRPDRPGRALARTSDGLLEEFQVALVAPPEQDHLVVSRAGRRSESTPARDRARETAGVVDVISRAALERGTPRPTPPWLPPLPPVVARGAEGCGPGVLALVDEPDHQRRSTLRWTSTTTLWRFAGRPLSGRTAALRALVLAAAECQAPDDLRVHVVDSAGGLSALRGLPHVGTWCRADDTDAVRALAGHLRTVVDRARSSASGPTSGITMLVIDGWEALTEADDPRAPEPLSDSLVRVLRDGAGAGVVAAVAGGRALLHSRWAALGGELLLLGDVDPLEAAAVGLRADGLVRDPPPGRATRVHGAREVQVVQATRADLAAAGRRWPPPLTPPWRYRPLPVSVRRAEVPAAVGGEDDGLLLGVGGPTASAVRWDPRGTGGLLVVVGPSRSGRTNALLVLAAAARSRGQVVALVGGRGGGAGGGPTPSAIGTPPAGTVVLGPDDVDAFVALRRAVPDLVVLVDDADQLDDAAVTPALREAADLVARHAGAFVVATSTAALATRFRGLDVDVARAGCGLVLCPSPAHGEVLGIRPRSVERRPGRGLWVRHGEARAVQVLLHEGPASDEPLDENTPRVPP